MNDFDIAFAVVKLYVELNDGTTGTGTSFFYKLKKDNEEKIVLITNKHVLNNVRQITFFIHSDFNAPSIIRKLTLSGNDINRIVIEHPSNYDVCALDVNNYLNDDAYFLLTRENQLSAEEIKENAIMENVFIVGYPIGLEDSLNKLPLFTTGTTATSISIDYNGMPTIMINAFALPGSSGSPVFVKRNNKVKLVGIINSINVLNEQMPISNLCYAVKSNLINEIESLI